jgi:hypothetical protein
VREESNKKISADVATKKEGCEAMCGGCGNNIDEDPRTELQCPHAAKLANAGA